MASASRKARKTFSGFVARTRCRRTVLPWDMMLLFSITERSLSHDWVRIAQSLPQGRPAAWRADRRVKKFSSGAQVGSRSDNDGIGEALLARAQSDARAQKFLRIDGVAVDAGFVIQMRTGGAAGRADLADHLADLHDIADLDVDCGEMAVAGGEPVAVIDLDHAAIAALPAG